jgi:hypothetical protein
MLKKKEPELQEEQEKGELAKPLKAKVQKSGNGETTAAILNALKALSAQNKELFERMADIEKKSTAADALLRMVNLMYDTDDKHLPELTRIPINAVRPHALGMMLESLMDEDVQSGKVPLSRILRNNYFRLMRSVGGVHLGRGVRLAEEQASAEAEKAEEMELGEAEE